MHIGARRLFITPIRRTFKARKKSRRKARKGGGPRRGR